MIAPDSAQVVQELGITSSVADTLITPAFVFGYAIGLLIFGPFNEICGQSHALQLASLWHLA
ncbi:hypothetical protein FIBSPDRAFT_949956 [Athelia psychrophila]|uniref:Major facilitator superfamily (MFS) profile domain-containing protein n=1 Tax=Athelia psychrophila TaxID=1759441 RepID=A0A166P8M3_9AGAM|nr:hypothetical protein FIBSPDRAFT_949956 [Fibularhizoctonia sp. CBS 109695]